MKFVHVFGDEARCIMISRGYQYLYSIEGADVHVFLNKDTENFAELDIPCVFSDTLTF